MMGSLGQMVAWPSPPQVFEQDRVLGSADLDRRFSSGLQDAHIEHVPGKK